MEDEVRPLLYPSSEEVPQILALLPWDQSRARKSGIWILISVIFERLAYYTVVMNLFLYLNAAQSEVIIMSFAKHAYSFVSDSIIS